jgi:hypothetical protein
LDHLARFATTFLCDCIDCSVSPVVPLVDEAGKQGHQSRINYADPKSETKVRQDQFPQVARKGDEDSADADQELGAEGHLVAAKHEGGNGKEVGANQVAQTVRKEDRTKLPLLNRRQGTNAGNVATF